MFRASVGKAFCLSTIFALAACGGNDKVGDDAPKLDIPVIIEWDENTAFSYAITATGAEPMTYQLLQSEDASRFSLDKNTGLLTSAAFDFEAPDDADQDHLYELNLIVQDIESRAASQEFIIRVVNKDELVARVSFPPAGANIGGFESQFHLRGYLSNEGQRVTQVPDNLQITVGNQSATFSADGTGEWIVEVPVSSGLNPMQVKLLQNGQEIYSLGYSLENTPIPMVGSAISNGSADIYSIDISGRSILLSSTMQLSLNDVSGLGCTSFNRIQFDDYGTQLLVSCIDQNSQETLFLHNIATGDNKTLVSGLAPNYSRQFEWINGEYLLFSVNSNFYNLVNLNTSEVKTIELLQLDESSDYEPWFYIANGAIFIYTYHAGFYEWFAHDLQSILDDPANSIQINPLASGIQANFSGQVASAENFVYFVHNNSIEVLDTDNNSVDNLQLEPSNDANQLFNGTAVPAIVYVGSSSLILRSPGNGSLYKIDRNTGLTTAINGKYNDFVGLGWDLSVSPEGDEIVTYDHSSHQFVRASYGDFSVSESKDLSNYLWDSNYAYGKMDFDWANNILYRHRVIFWGGAEPNPEPLVFAYHIEDDYEQPLLTSYDLYDLVGDSSLSYRIGETIVTDNPNELWFSWLALNPAGGALEGVGAYNVVSQSVSPVYQYFNDSSVIQSDDPYLSSWSDSINGVVLTEWNDGYVALLDKNGTFTELQASFSPYGMTNSADIDDQRNLLYYNGFVTTGDNNIPDYATVEINEINLNTGEQRLVASATKGYGFNFAGSELKLNENNKVLLGTYGGLLVIIDTYTGDRVLKTVK